MDSVIAFGADKLDPSMVCAAFLPLVFDRMILGAYKTVEAISQAFSREVGKHTEILLLERGRISKFSSAPYSMPQGEVVTCCGQPMQYRRLCKRRQGQRTVQLRCRLGKDHIGTAPHIRHVPCARSIPGIQTVDHKQGHRILIRHFETAIEAYGSIMVPETSAMASY
jgi:hypothetical protein